MDDRFLFFGIGITAMFYLILLGHMVRRYIRNAPDRVRNWRERAESQERMRALFGENVKVR